MIARKDLIEKVIKYLNTFVLEVRSYNVIGTYDINIHAENTLIPILNSIFDLELTNVNHQKKNFPAVDLVDAKNGVAFQVTATSSVDKVNETVKKFVQYDLHKTYQTLFIYILTEKEEKYNDTKTKEFSEGKVDFDPAIHVIDYTDILRRINSIVAVEKIQTIARLFEHEFSEVQITSRQKKFRDGFLRNNPEDLYLNLVRVHFSSRLYIADTSYDKKEAGGLSRQQNKGIKSRKKLYNPDALFKAIISTRDVCYVDWVIREDKLITFRNLHDPNESLTHFIDRGTVEAFAPQDFYEESEDKLNIFKALLKNCLRHLCYTLSMEWVHDRKILRFRNDEGVPREKKTKWRGKKESVKTVIFEVMSKKKEAEESHIVCFRNMAFEPGFHLLDDTWYMSINPTWSFTNPGGFKTSGFESTYMSGLKRMENNNTVYYQFRFFTYFLSNIPPLFVEQYPHLKIEVIDPISFSPAIEDKKWVPPKEFAAKNVREAELFEDKELNSNSF